MTITVPLKGGSLSKTYRLPQHNMVGKDVKSNKEREYGFMRWYSQTKKMQRLSALHPDLFPKILDVHADGDTASLKMEWLDGYQDVKTILSTKELTGEQIFKISKAIWNAFDRIHSRTYDAIPGAGNLYYIEEVCKKFDDAVTCSDDFKEFAYQPTFEYNRQIVHTWTNYLYDLGNFFSDLILPYEQDILGNPTLENIMYSFEEDKVKFIDLYEESMIDTRFLDYSMVLQCSRSHYGFINDNQVKIGEFSATHELQIPSNFETFNSHFSAELPEEHQKLIDIFEATQFMRMLPFKIKAGDIDKAKYFYVHACYLLGKVL
jgi:hypothetical protein